jgi:hypothetical protein
VRPVIITKLVAHPSTGGGRIHLSDAPCETHWSNGLMTNGSTPFANHSVRLSRVNKLRLGRHVLGVAAIFLGVITLVWHDFNGWQQIDALGKGLHREILAYIVGTIAILVGLAVQWSRTTRAGAITLVCVFSFFALLWIPRIIATPLVYDPWGNFFEQSSQLAGALIVYATVGRGKVDCKPRLAHFAYLLFAISVISFMLLCKALLDRITDRAHILETGKESYRFRRTLDQQKKGGKPLEVAK